jgi:histidinol-phosphatase
VAARDDDLALALELADVADEITLSRFQASDLVVETKPDLTPVTEADKAVERTLRDRLAVARPGDAIVGEEYGSSETPESGRRWIVDPIDGTKNYVRGIPVWATLLALQEGDEVTVGVVSAPALHRRWWAAKGAGAFMSDGLTAEPRRLRVSAVRALEDAQLCTSGLDGWDSAGGLDGLLTLARRCWRTRGFGDFWIYMLVAEGVAEIGCEAAVSLWDLAAPQVIVEEAGGRLTDLTGAVRPDGGDSLTTAGRRRRARHTRPATASSIR